jgi:N-acetylglucosaminyl-diphospho-decaprenol L-rhamnosyltransferase
MRPDRPLVDVVTVNWNAGEQLRNCLQSLADASQQDHQLASVTVVDNASSDGSADGLSFPGLPLQVVRNQANRGAAVAYNQGAARGSAEYLLFVNPDTVLSPRAIDTAVAVLESPSHRKTGLASIQFRDETGRIATSCARFPSPWSMTVRALGLDRIGWLPSYVMSEWPHDETRIVDHVSAAFFLVRRRVFDEIGGFDERFFVYLEDLDFCFRVHLAGWNTVYVAEAQAFHKEGGTSERVPDRRITYALRSRLSYAQKHFGLGGRAMVSLATLALEPMIRLARAAGRRSMQEAATVVRAYRLLWSERD